MFIHTFTKLFKYLSGTSSMAPSDIHLKKCLSLSENNFLMLCVVTFDDGAFEINVIFYVNLLI